MSEYARNLTKKEQKRLKMYNERTISSGKLDEKIIALETLNLIEEASSWSIDADKTEDLKEFYDYVSGAVDLSMKLIRKLNEPKDTDASKEREE